MIRKLLLGTVAAGGLLGAALPASAADLAVRPPPAPYVAPVAPIPVFTWSGWYIGGNAGAAWRTRDVVIDPTFYPGYVTLGDGGFGCGAFSCDAGRRTVFTGGGQLGFNVQTGAWVWGAEGDINFIGRRHNQFLGTNTFVVGPGAPAGVARGTYTVTGFTNGTDEGDWFATVRGRLGFAFDRWLVYGTGGVAFHDPGNETAVTITGPTGATTTLFPQAGHRVGYAAGVGGEYAITNNVTVGVEWLHLGFGSSRQVDPVLSTINGTTTLVGIRQDVDVVRARLNFKFGSLFGL